MTPIITRPLKVFPELCYTGGLVLLFYILFTPVIWGHQGGSSLTFKPYAPPAGYIPSIPCVILSNNLVNGTTNNTSATGTVNLRFARSATLIRHVAVDPRNDVVRSPTILSKVPATVSESLQALWIGPLGSCSRDPDGRTWCTKPSVLNPQFNLTSLQANPIYYPAGMSSLLKTKAPFAFLIIDLIGFVVYIFIGSFYIYPSLFSRVSLEVVQGWAALLVVGMALNGFSRFFVNLLYLNVGGVDAFNEVDNFYELASCGKVRQLKPGVLMQAFTGYGWKMLWTSWCLIFVISLFFLAVRVAWLYDSRTAALAKEVVEEAKKKRAAALRERQEKAAADPKMAEAGSSSSTAESATTTTNLGAPPAYDLDLEAGK